MKGKVFLTGAGPGDWQLLTLAAVKALQKADCVVYDRLADERILRFVLPTAERIYVGKSSGNHTMTQTEINNLLIEKAETGKTVVRLKGGDPFVFGRGGEEALALREHNIEFVVIPGVTSAVAVPAYAGIPVTHRGIAASFAVVTGHEDPAKENSGINWEKLATAVDTLVFLMGVKNLPQIVKKLLINGRPAETPAALISWGTKPEQKKLITTLGEAVSAAEEAGVKPPAVFLVGEVVSLTEKLQWFDSSVNRPLYGKKILVTRSARQAPFMTGKLEEHGAQVFELPLIEIKKPSDDHKALDEAIKDLGTFDWLVLTSVNGVEQFFDRLFAAGLDARAITGRVAVIGRATADRLKQFGIKADVIPERFQAEDLLAALTEVIKAGDKILLARAEKARPLLAEGLKKLGATVTEAGAYCTMTADVSTASEAQRLRNGDIDYVTFASPSAVDSFVKSFGKELMLESKIICIGPITAAACRKYGAEPLASAEEYTVDGITETLLRVVKEAE